MAQQERLTCNGFEEGQTGCQPRDRHGLPGQFGLREEYLYGPGHKRTLGLPRCQSCVPCSFLLGRHLAHGLWHRISIEGEGS